jgi:hypothetical protein
MPNINVRIAGATNGALLRVAANLFTSPLPGGQASASLLNPTAAPSGVGTGMNYFNNRLCVSDGLGGIYEQISFYPDQGTTTPFNPPASPSTFNNGMLTVANPYSAPLLVRAVTGFNMRLPQGITTESPQPFMYMYEPLLGTFSQCYKIGDEIQFYLAGGPQIANNFNLSNLSDITNRIFRGASAFDGCDLNLWVDGLPAFQQGPYGVSFTSHPAFDTFINTAGGDYVVNLAVNGFIFTFRTNGTGPTGQRQEVVITNMDMTQYTIVRWHPQDATAKAQMSRGAWSAMSDLNGVVWFNSGAPGDVAFPLASIAMQPQILPLGSVNPIALPCFEPCPSIP